MVSVHKSMRGQRTGVTSRSWRRPRGGPRGPELLGNLSILRNTPQTQLISSLALPGQSWQVSDRTGPSQREETQARNWGYLRHPQLSLKGARVAQKAARPKALVTQPGSQSASPKAEEGRKEEENPGPAPT